MRKNVSLSSLSSNLSNLWIRSEKIIHFRLGIKIVVKVFFFTRRSKIFFLLIKTRGKTNIARQVKRQNISDSSGRLPTWNYYATIMEKLPWITDNPLGRKKYICGWNVGGGSVRN